MSRTHKHCHVCSLCDRSHVAASAAYAALSGRLYKTGDKVRVKVDMTTRQLYFELNGQDLGLAAKDLPARLYPAFSLFNHNQISLGECGYW